MLHHALHFFLCFVLINTGKAFGGDLLVKESKRIADKLIIQILTMQKPHVPEGKAQRPLFTIPSHLKIFPRLGAMVEGVILSILSTWPIPCELVVAFELDW